MAQAFVSFVAKFGGNLAAFEAAVQAQGGKLVHDPSGHYIQILAPPTPSPSPNKGMDNFAHETILDKETLRVVSFGLPKMQPVSLDQVATVAKEAAAEISATVIQVATMVRVFYCERTQTWRLTSSGLFDAHADFAYDCPNSVGDLLERCLGRIYGHQMRPFNELPIVQKMDKGKTYHFMLQHKDLHRDFVQHTKLFIVAVFDPKGVVFVPAVADKLPTLQDVVFKNASELTAFVANKSETDSMIIGVAFTVGDTCYKVFTDRYLRDMALLCHNTTPNPYLIGLKNYHDKEALLERFPSFSPYLKQIKAWRGKVSDLIMGGFNKRISSSTSCRFISPLVKELHLHEKKLYQTNHLGIKFVTYEIVNTFLDTHVSPERLNSIFIGLDYYQFTATATTATTAAKATTAATVATATATTAAKAEATTATIATATTAAKATIATAATAAEPKKKAEATAVPVVAKPEEIAVPKKKEEAAAQPEEMAPVVAQPKKKEEAKECPVQLRKQKVYLKGLLEPYLRQKMSLSPPYDTLFIVSRMTEMPLEDLKMVLSDKWALSDFIDKYYTQLRNGLEELALQMRLTPAEVAYFQQKLPSSPPPVALERKKAAYVRDYVVMPYLAKKMATMPAMQPFDTLYIVFRLLDMDIDVSLFSDPWTLMSIIDKYYNELRTWVEECIQEQFLNIQLSTTDMLFFIKYHSN
jgi:hypothetical protein